MVSPLKKTQKEKIVVASHNPGKVSEMGELLSKFNVRPCSAKSLGLEEPDETGKTFVENSELKAKAASEASGFLALADDSGLVIPALGGAPGIYSARWALDKMGKDRGFSYAIDKIEKKLRNKGLEPDGLLAHFVCALSLAWPGGKIVTYEGFAHGNLTFPPKGKRGFGYDPIFKPRNYNLTYGEMNPEEKHRISHRANAFSKLSKKCFD